MESDAPPRWVFYVALVFGAGPLVVFYLVDTGQVVFQDPLSGTGLALAVLAAALPVVDPSWWKPACVGTWTGAVGTSAVYLFATGPGTLWPIALGFVAIAAGVPIAAGTWLGFEVGRLVNRRRRSERR